jgi:hypothetical protein
MTIDIFNWGMILCTEPGKSNCSEWFSVREIVREILEDEETRVIVKSMIAEALTEVMKRPAIMHAARAR